MGKDADLQLKELVAIKKLLVLDLLRSGLSQTQVAAALGVDRSQVSRMFPSGALAGISKEDRNDE